MKQAARKKPQLSIVRSSSRAEDSAKESADSLEEFFSGWLDAVVPDLIQSRQGRIPARTSGYRRRRVSSTDIVRLNRATVRESSDHRHWPPEVVAQFLAAEVIRRNDKSN